MLKTAGYVLAALLGGAAVAVVVAVILLERGYFDPFIGRQASAALGREVRLEGPIDLDLGREVTVSLGPVTVGNPSWAIERNITEPLASVQRLSVTIRLWPLLSGKVVLPRVVIDQPEGHLVRLEDSRANWQFPDLGNGQASMDSSPGRPPPDIGEAHLNGGKLTYRDAMTKRDLSATADAAIGPDNARHTLQATIGVTDNQKKDAPAQTIQFSGWIKELFSPQDGFELTAQTKGDRADDVLALAGVETKDRLPAYDLTVTVGRDDRAWRLVNLQGALGDNKIKGNGSVEDPATLAGLQFEVDVTSPRPGDLMADFGLGKRRVPALDLRAWARRENDRNFLSVAGKLGDDRINLDASTDGPLGELRDLKLDAEAKGTQLGRLLPLAGLTEKPVPAYALDAKASRAGEWGADIDAKLTLGRTTLTAKGTVGDLKSGQGIDLQSTAQGQDLAEILDIFGLPKISIPPYKVAGRVGRDGDVISVDKLDGRVGDSDVAGDVAVDIGQTPAFVKADLASDRLEFADLAGLVGAPPGAGPGKVASAEQKQEARELAAEQRLIPDAQFDARTWRNLNLDVRFRGKSVNAPKVPIQNLAFHVRTKNGLIMLDPFEAVVAQGKVNAYAAIDGRKTPVATDLDLRVRQLQLNEFMRRFGLANDALGVFSGRAQLRGTGSNVRQMAATANGRVALTMAGGSIDRLIPEAAGLDIGQAVATYLRRMFGRESKNTTIRCAVADLGVTGGIVTTRTVLVDMPNDKLTLQGKISLRDEQMDLMFHAYPRDASVASARMPIAISGPIRNPSLAPAPGYVENRPLGWALAPLAALLPFIELGSEDDQPCAGVVQ